MSGEAGRSSWIGPDEWIRGRGADGGGCTHEMDRIEILYLEAKVIRAVQGW
jgi:hypothetical protein